MPARRKKRRNAKKTSNSFLKPVLVLVFIFFIFLLITSRTGHWDKTKKLALVTAGKDNISLFVFDKELEEITAITIPANTQVAVSRQLGTWKLGSVWQLGENEGLDGQLLAETVTRHFKLPVFAWADSQALGFVKGGPFSLFKATFFPYKTNLMMGDRIKIGLFSLRISDYGKEEIDFSKSSFLKETKLVDGGKGYIISGKIPAKITSLFSDTEILEKNAKVLIVDATGTYGLAEELGQIVEILGAKVAAIEDEEKGDFDCILHSRDDALATKFADAFSCEIGGEGEEGNFDLVIKLGTRFWRRF